MGEQFSLFGASVAPVTSRASEPEPLAIISPCGTYRYLLRRLVGKGTQTRSDRVLFLMLNPSTADATKNDPTVRRCIGYATKWGFSGLTIVNLFALRSTDKKVIVTSSKDPIGPDNDAHIAEQLRLHTTVVLGWGGLPGGKKHSWVKARAEQVTAMVARERPLLCFGRGADGEPWHPLRLKGDLQPIPYARGA